MTFQRSASFASAFVLALVLAAGAPAAAQKPTAQAQEAPTAQAQEAPAAQAQEAPSAEATRAPGHAGEAEEGHAHHPEVRLFGKLLNALQQFGVAMFNFILFAGLLFVLLKGVLASAFSARRRELEDKLSQAEREKAEAERQIQELEARMAGLQQELAGIMARADADADAEKERILESAKAEAAQILAQTRTEIASQQRSAEAELRALVADLVVAGATQRLEARVRGSVAAQVLDHAIDQVGGAQ